MEQEAKYQQQQKKNTTKKKKNPKQAWQINKSGISYLRVTKCGASDTYCVLSCILQELCSMGAKGTRLSYFY